MTTIKSPTVVRINRLLLKNLTISRQAIKQLIAIDRYRILFFIIYSRLLSLASSKCSADEISEKSKYIATVLFGVFGCQS
jgi:hypothetical protein